MLEDIDLTSINSAADLYTKLNSAMGIDSDKKYYDRKSNLSPDEYESTIERSTTIYVGNLPQFMHESVIVSYFDMIYPP